MEIRSGDELRSRQLRAADGGVQPLLSGRPGLVLIWPWVIAKAVFPAAISSGGNIIRAERAPETVMIVGFRHDKTSAVRRQGHTDRLDLRG